MIDRSSTVMRTGDAPASAVGTSARARLTYLDNLRVALIVLVVIHHAAQAYGPGDWWYVLGQPGTESLATFSLVNGSFFMGLFFFISAYLVPQACDAKGPWSFMRGRLLRLGVPLLVGTFTIIPGLMYAYYASYRGYPPLSFADYFTSVFLGFDSRPPDWSGPSWPDLQFGHLWFLENLLVYSGVYAAWRWLIGRRQATRASSRPVPGHRALALFTLVVATATFLIRIEYPLDTWVPVFGFIQAEPARAAQYIALFAAGIAAYRHDWLTRLPTRTGYIWLVIGISLSVIFFVSGGAQARYFAFGGVTLSAFCWSLFETAMCTGLCVGLLTLFRGQGAGSNSVLRASAASSFAVYIFHLPIVVALQFAFAGSGLSAHSAFVAVAVLAILISFPVAGVVRRLPGFRAVL